MTGMSNETPDTELEANAFTRYQWDCPACGDVNDVETDPAGGIDECGECGALVRIVETR
jgi:hypothetical protein